MKDRGKKRTLAVIPCYNEEPTIGSIVLKTKRHVNTVLVVDDGSSDDTSKVAKQAGAVVISNRKNHGKGSVIKTGFRYALANNYDYVVTLDGDGQHNPDEVPAILGDLMNNGHDITIGLRYGNSTEMPKWRKVGKRILDYATSFGNGGHVTDSQCGFRAFNKKAVENLIRKLNSKKFSTESEQLIKAHELGLKVSQKNITCKYKNLNTSSKDPFLHGFSVLSYIIWLIAERRPLLFISLPGFVLVMIGLFFGILTLQHYNQTHVFLIQNAILISIFLIIGVIALFIGLLLNVLPRIIKQGSVGE